MDSAVKNYYEKRAAAIRAGVSSAVAPVGKSAIAGKRLYVAAINNSFPKVLNDESKYMRVVLLDQYRDAVPAYFIGEVNEQAPLTFEEMRAKAADAGCDRMTIVNIWGKKQEDPADYSGGLMTKGAEAFYLLFISSIRCAMGGIGIHYKCSR